MELSHLEVLAPHRAVFLPGLLSLSLPMAVEEAACKGGYGTPLTRAGFTEKQTQEGLHARMSSGEMRAG